LPEEKKSKEHFAARFAAKEAVLKAIGTGIGKEIDLKDVEILSSNSGKPRVCLHGRLKEIAFKRKIEKIELSFSHCDAYAVAQAMIISKKENRGIKE
jgi:holo-[acyl-carrier protein] synthase